MSDSRDQEFNQLQCLADIRAAIGDPEGRLMQDELVDNIKELMRRVSIADSVIGDLTSGCWLSQIDQLDDGKQRIAERLREYFSDSGCKSIK